MAALGPGLLVAATGVGAGDLATAGFAGSKLGLAILWAVTLGAFLKFVLTEGLARWQLATGKTLLEGAVEHFGRPVLLAFLVYLLAWSFFTGGALVNACGAAAHAILPAFDDAATGKLAFGALQSALALALALIGGFKLFERVMAVCVGVMFVSVVVTAARLVSDWGALGIGLVVPSIPELHGEGLIWTIALMGGVGGTVTVLCYGYWIRELGRDGRAALRTCRIDLAAGYVMTALFGISMIIIASGVPTTGSGVGLIVGLADQLGATLGPGARWLFLVGVWAAVFSSMLGVWQAVPYLFADFVTLLGRRWRARPDAPAPPIQLSRTWTYRGYALALATLPLITTAVRFDQIQKLYAVIGAAFIPLLALSLLILNGRERWVGREMRNRPVTVIILVLTLLITGTAGVFEVHKRWTGGAPTPPTSPAPTGASSPSVSPTALPTP